VLQGGWNDMGIIMGLGIVLVTLTGLLMGIGTAVVTGVVGLIASLMVLI
jgi:hypothetical protein